MYFFLNVYKWLSKWKEPQLKIFKAVAVAMGLNLCFGTSFYFTEHSVQNGLTVWDSIWWAMVTMTTVGYGDIAAKTWVGRFLISYPCMIIGIGIIGYLIGAVAESVFEKISRKRKGLMSITDTNHLIICNCPAIETVLLLVTEIRANRSYKNCSCVVITEHFDETPDEFKIHGIQFLRGAPRREEILMKANILACAGVFILAENPKNPASDEKTFAVGTIIEMLKKEKGLSFKVVAELVSQENMKMMKRSQIDGIVTPDGITDCLMVQEFLSPGVHGIIQQIISNMVGCQFYILDTSLQGFLVTDIQIAALQHPADMQVIGIVKNGKQTLNPPKNMKIEANDKLIIIAETADDFKSLARAVLATG